MNLQPILAAILEDYALPPNGDHGVAHWARVLENGRRLAAVTGANLEIVSLSAVLHDSRRASEDEDPDHGVRGAEFAATLRGRLRGRRGADTNPEPVDCVAAGTWGTLPCRLAIGQFAEVRMPPRIIATWRVDWGHLPMDPQTSDDPVHKQAGSLLYDKRASGQLSPRYS
jgi:hypothetical protein